MRLILAFVLVTAASTLATTVWTLREARATVLQDAQETVAKEFREQVDSAASELPFPPDQHGLDQFAAHVAAGSAHDWRVLAQYDSLTASAPTDPSSLISDELRDSTSGAQAGGYQRVLHDGEPLLTVALSVSYAGSSAHTPSGLQVYLVTSLNTQQQTLDALWLSAQRGVVPGVLLALLLALLLSRGVLRPVRDLNDAAQQLGAGQLHVRLSVSGAHELANLSRTFNSTAAALETTVSELRRLEENARRFAADVSHELRTPLAAMSVVTDILVDDIPDLLPESATAVRLIIDETTNLARLVEDLMEISRFDAGTAVLWPEDVDVTELVLKALSRRNWLDRVTADLQDGVRARLDARRIDVVIANLVGNALRHGAPPIRIRTEATTDHVLFEVSDHGPGLPPEVLPHVFERFYKADSARARSEGSGLGLSISAENIRLHDGTITAGNGLDAGASFRFTLPLRPSAESEETR
ncbi:ATP-binding protein [Streptomyces tubercidicus]|uniref:ATP-binding protein n=1 Tax=Streptomyces tubercidicus TaxID=47759 RepID=UPI00368B8979